MEIVEISDGKLRGSKRINLEGGEFLSFLGIPYGKPPIGDLRFKAPQPVEPWEGVLDATKEGDASYQLDFQEGSCSEDCLNLNVFTKELPQPNTPLKPVMVYIHGGAFIVGSIKLVTKDPKYLLTEDIVLVTVHYRLGLLGFLSLEDTSLGVPGNAGLKDQLLALKWVQKNIKKFGGDPDNVTIFGESAGGAMAQYHMLSQQSRGLFHKVILQSGCILNPWGYVNANYSDFIKSLGGAKSEKEGFEILKNLSAHEINLKQAEFINYELEKLTPVIEKPNETAFLTENPLKVMASGNYNKVPIMIGYCSDEGMLFAGKDTITRSTTNLIFNKNPDWKSLEDFIPSYMQVEKGSETSSAICKKFADFYFQGPNAADKILFPTDYHFTPAIIETAKMHVRTTQNPAYLYRMSVVAGLNVQKIINNLENYPGTCHGDDVGYLFYHHYNFKFGEKERIAVKRFVKLWTNFAKYGNPTPDENDLKIQWKPIEADAVHFLDIGDELTTHVDPEPERVRVWKEVFQLSPHTSQYL